MLWRFLFTVYWMKNFYFNKDTLSEIHTFVECERTMNALDFTRSFICGTGGRRGQEEEAEGAEKHFHQIAEGRSYRQKKKKIRTSLQYFFSHRLQYCFSHRL